MAHQRLVFVSAVIIKSWTGIIFQAKNYCTILLSLDNRILLALAAAELAAEGYTVYQTDVVQAFCQCMENWTMLIFTLILLLDTRAPLEWCSNFSKPSTVLPTLQ
jgi:hypothetical protein